MKAIFARPIRSLLASALFSVITAQIQPCLGQTTNPPIIPSTIDLWDISQGSVVTGTSGAHTPYSDIRDMFGGNFSETETGKTVFADGQPPGFVHYVQWQTTSPVTVSFINLFAGGDGPTANNQREFSKFVLKAKSNPASTNYDLTLYTLNVTNHPYVFLDSNNLAVVSTNITPVTAQYFRAEFTQYTAGNGFDGPRIIELDGFGSNTPVILSGPANQSVGSGTTATFTVSAAGPQLFYQWFENNTLIPAALNASATNATLVLTNVQLGQSGNLYSVVVSNIYNSTNSTNALLAVFQSIVPSSNDLWDISQGSVITSNSGANVPHSDIRDMFGGTFSPTETGKTIFADGQPAGFVHFVQWQTPVPVNISSINLFAGGDGPQAALPTQREFAQFVLKAKSNPANTNYDLTLYTLVVTNHPYIWLDSNNAALVSTAIPPVTAQYFRAEFTQYAAGGGHDGPRVVELDGFGTNPPVILAGPTNQNLIIGATATFNVSAYGPPGLSYQWLQNNTNIPSGSNATATNAVLVLTNVQLSQSGNQYSVLVSNIYGSTNSSAASLMVTPPVCIPPPAGLVSWWAAEGNTADCFGTNSGLPVNGPCYTNGEAGQAFNLDGATQFVNVADSPSLNPTNAISVEAWIFPRQFGNVTPIVKKAGEGSAQPDGFSLEYDNPSGVAFWVYSATSLQWFSSAHVAVPLNQWSHLVGVYDGASVYLYLNGTLAGAPVPLTGPVKPSGNDLRIGNDPSNPGSYFNGLIDEASLYNTGLSASQAQSLYLAGSLGKCVPQSAPTMVAQPVSGTAATSGAAVFNALAAGPPALAYQWLENNTNIPAALNATATNIMLVLTNLNTNQSGNLYSVMVTNSYGSTTSLAARLTVVPAIVPSPNDLWDISQGSVVTGNSGTATTSDIRDMFGGSFSQSETTKTIFSDQQPPGFVHYVQWQTPVPVNVSSFNLIGGGDGAAFNNEREFSKFVLKAKSNPANTNYDLTLYSLELTSHPYVFMDSNNFAVISAAITPVTAQYFRAEFTQYTAGRGFDGPRINELDGFGSNAPSILAGPASQTISAGSTAFFNVGAYGSPAASYQWLVNNTLIPAALNASATNATLILANVQPGLSGNVYSVRVSNIYGSTSSTNAFLTVTASSCSPPPSGLVGWWAAEGNALDSVGTNNGTLMNGVGFTPGEVGQAFTFNGANQYISTASPRMSNIVDSYTMEFWARPSAARADTAEANNGITGISNQRYAICPTIDPSSALAGVGVSVGTNGVSVFEHANGYLPSLLVYDTSITNWTHVAVVYSNRQPRLYLNGVLVRTGVTSARSSCPSASLGENGYNYGYYGGLLDEVSIYNRPLTATEIQAIYIAGSGGKCSAPPAIAMQPANQNVILGQTATLNTVATGTMPLSYQWLFNGAPIPPAINATAAGPMLVLTNVQPTNAGIYSVMVTNLVGSTNSSNAVLTILFPPRITLNPRSELARPGCLINFTASATGTGTQTYQWLKNGTNLAGQTGTNLTIADAQSNDFTGYALIASNAYGAATSTVALLQLDSLPVVNGTIVQRYPGGGIRFSAASLLANASDADGDLLSVESVNSNSLAGGTVSLSGAFVAYLPPAGYTNADAFNFTVSDGHCGGTTLGTVLVEVRSDLNPASQVAILLPGDGTVQVIFQGMPGTTYRVQSADTLTPTDWQDVASLTADQFGTYIYVDYPATNGPVRYFRSVSP